MLKLPAIMAPCLLGKKVNSENLKKTIMEKEFTFKQETIELFQEITEKKIIKINGIKDLQTKDLLSMGERLGLLNDKKTAEMIKIDLVNLSKIFLGGR